jgi:hypothetical protein
MAGEVVVNVIGFARQDTLGAETPADAAAVANQVAIAWKARVMNALCASLVFQQVTARGMIEPQVSGVSIESSKAGVNTTTSLPSYVAAKVVFGTATPGRAGRGRTGLSGLPEVGTDGVAVNSLTASYQSDLASAMNLFMQDLAALTPTIFPVVISRFQGTDVTGKPVPRPGGPIASTVISTSVMSKLGTRVSRIR